MDLECIYRVGQKVAHFNGPYLWNRLPFWPTLYSIKVDTSV